MSTFGKRPRPMAEDNFYLGVLVGSENALFDGNVIKQSRQQQDTEDTDIETEMLHIISHRDDSEL